MFKQIRQLLFPNRRPTPPTLLVLEEPVPIPEALESFDCPSCGGPLDIDFIGRHQADKVASCPYCEQIIDLPDADDANSKVRTSERIIERPNERIVERVSEWSRSSSTPLDWPEDLPGGLDELTSDLRSRLLPKRPGEASSAPPVIWQIDGQTFSSADEVRAYVEENMPAGMADRVLTLIDADRPRE